MNSKNTQGIWNHPISTKFPKSTTTERRKFVYELLMEQSDLTAAQVIGRLKKKFGVVMHHEDVEAIRRGELTLTPVREVVAVPTAGLKKRRRRVKKVSSISAQRHKKQLPLEFSKKEAPAPVAKALSLVEQLRMAGATKITYPDGMVVEFAPTSSQTP